MTDYVSLFKEYPYLSLMFTSAFGVLMYQVRKMPSRLWRTFLLTFSIEVYVDDKCDAFFLVERWISENPSVRSRNRKLALADTFRSSVLQRKKLDRGASNYLLSPGSSASFFFYNGVFVFFTKKVPLQDESRAGTNSNNNSYTLLFFTRSHARVERFVAELETGAVEEGDVSIYAPDFSRIRETQWKIIAAKKPRSLDTVFLVEGQKERILADINRFVASKKWYEDRGIPHRRGYLFSGPPGTGKTSLLLSLCGYYNRPMCIANISSFEKDADLLSAVVTLPKNSIVVFEDVDRVEAVGESDRIEVDESVPRSLARKRVTVSGLLNALDGVLTPSGMMFILTTNHPEKLDPALLRPGRIDVHEVIGLLGIKEQLKMAALFYSNPDGFCGLAEGITPASLQRAFMLYPDDPIKANEFIVLQHANTLENHA